MSFYEHFKSSEIFDFNCFRLIFEYTTRKTEDAIEIFSVLGSSETFDSLFPYGRTSDINHIRLAEAFYGFQNESADKPIKSSKFNHLKELYVAYTEKSDEESLLSMISQHVVYDVPIEKAFDNLFLLSIINCNNFTGVSLKHLTNLQSLTLDDCPVFNQFYLSFVTTIKTLSVSFNRTMNWRYVFETMKSLESLSVTFSSFDAKFLFLLNSLQNLRIYGCTIFNFVDICKSKKLKELYIATFGSTFDESELNIDSLEKLTLVRVYLFTGKYLNKMKKLKILCLSECSSFDPKNTDECKNLKIIFE